MATKMLSASTDTRAYMAVMSRIRKKEFPDSVSATLNRVANGVTLEQKRIVKSELTIRKKFTINSMQSKRAKPFKALNKALGDNVARMFSRAGTFSRYLWKQEKTMTVRGVQRRGVPIPTLFVRRGNLQKAIYKDYRLRKKDSLRDGPFRENQFIGRPRGGGKRGIYLRSKEGKLIMIRNLEHKKVRIKGIRFHQRAVDRFGNNRKIAAVYRREAQKRLGMLSRG